MAILTSLNWTEVNRMKLRRLGSDYQLDVTEAELRAFQAGLREALQELPEWEFFARTGFQRDEMKAILADFHILRRELEREPNPDI